MEIALDKLTKKFPGRGRKKKPVVAVDDLTYTVPDGKLVALLGPSGCGKSTTLNMICGLLEPTSGKIFFGDKDVTNIPPEQRGVGMVFQNYALYPHLTVEQNIRFPLENLKGDEKLSKEEMNKRVQEAAKLVAIDELLDRKPKELSGGQQQRVAIARALVKLPKVLLLDEPLSNLDARLRLATREEIRRIQKETGITTVFVTHDQDEAMSISDIILVMKEGKLQQAGKPQEVYDHPANLFVAQFLGTPPINVFNARIEEGKLYIGSDAVLDTPGLSNQKVVAAIRPEGFILEDNGPLVLDLVRPEVLGRDISIVAKSKESQNEVVRAIIDADEARHLKGDEKTVRFSLKPNKVHIFNPETGIRIDIPNKEE